MKTVFSTSSEVAHQWANNVGRHVRSRNTFTSNDGSILYSYGTHFRLAQWTVDKDGNRIAVLNKTDRSVTTNKHEREVHRALPHGTRYVIGIPGDHEETTNYYRGRLIPLIEKLAKARKPEIYLEDITIVRELATEYYATFGLDIPGELLTSTATDYYAHKLATDGEYAARIQRESTEQERERRERQQQTINIFLSERLPKWRSGEGDNYLHDKPTGFDYFRMSSDGKRIVTSQNVQIPLLAACQLWKELLASPGYSYSYNYEHCLRILDFTVRAINPDSVVIGCHIFTWEELRYAAGLVGAPNADAHHPCETAELAAA